MRKKDEKKIEEILIEDISGKLLSNFKYQKNEDRDKIIIKNIIVEARVWVKLIEDSRSTSNMQLQNNDPIEFIFNKETDEFEIVKNNVVFNINNIY
jgi:hypothetical protein